MYAPRMATARCYIQRQAIPERIRLVAMRYAAPAVDVAVIRRSHVVVHRVPRSTIQPAAPTSLLKPETGTVALASVVGKFRTGEQIVVSLCQHEAVGFAHAIPNIWSPLRLHRLANADGLTKAVRNL